MGGVSRAALVVALMFVVVSEASWPGRMAARALRVQSDAAEAVQVATGPLSEPTLGLVGRTIASQDAITLVGYLTAVKSLDTPDLFVGDEHSIATARFTFAANVAIDSTNNRADTTTTDGSGVLRIYLNNDGGASWDEPSSFAAGQQVAEYTLDLRQTLQRQAPGVGVAVGDGRLVQSRVESFQIGEESFTFGLQDIEQRLRFVGAPLPNAANAQSPRIAFTGSVAVTRRPAILAKVGDPSIVATPAAEATDCAASQPFLTQAQDALTRARDAGAAIGANASIESIDIAATRRAAADIGALADQQRNLDLPVDAAAANQTVVSALSSYARGLQAVADAAEAQDADLLELAQITLQDGRTLIDRAAQNVAALSVDCASGGGSGS